LVVKVTEASVNLAAATPSRYSRRDSAPAMQPRMAFAYPLQAAAARGVIASPSAAAAEAVPGVIAALTPDHSPELAGQDDQERPSCSQAKSRSGGRSSAW